MSWFQESEQQMTLPSTLRDVLLSCSSLDEALQRLTNSQMLQWLAALDEAQYVAFGQDCAAAAAFHARRAEEAAKAGRVAFAAAEAVEAVSPISVAGPRPRHSTYHRAADPRRSDPTASVREAARQRTVLGQYIRAALGET